MTMNKHWSETARYVALVAVLAGLVWLLSAVRALVAPLVVAALLAYALMPGVTFLTARTRLGRRAAVILVYVLFLAVLIAVLVALVPIVIKQARMLSLELLIVRTKMERAAAGRVLFLGIDVPVGEFLDEYDAVSSQLLRPERVFRFVRGATSNGVWVLVIFVTTFYLLRDWEHLREWLIRLAPEAYQPDIRRLHQEIKDVWQAYLRGQLLVMLLVGILTGLASAALGLPGAATLGLLAGGLDLIPSLGPTATAVVAAIIAWFEGSTYLPISNIWFAAVVVVVYSTVQLVENVLLQPRIFGRALRLNSGIVFVAVVGALALGGALIALIIVPLLGSAAVLGRYLHRRMLGVPVWPDGTDSEAISSRHPPLDHEVKKGEGL
jgi:predicted PurR-regulated permease PerM